MKNTTCAAVNFITTLFVIRGKTAAYSYYSWYYYSRPYAAEAKVRT